MNKISGQKRAASHLYPAIDPFEQFMLPVTGGHEIYVEQCGSKTGCPVLVLHGGPGGGCSPSMRQYFDPQKYRIILFDQRGCGRSRPHAKVEQNTTWDLVNDIEAIRQKLNIESWHLFGGSWGSTLALLYAQAFPNRVSNLVLRGIFLMTPPELDWFYGGGAGQFFPDVWEKFTALIPEDEQGDYIAAYHRRLFSGDLRTEMTYAQAWSAWENALASIQANTSLQVAPNNYARAFARLENHYFINGGFLKPEQAILENMTKIAHIPGTIIQGRQDMICPPINAWRLAKKWPKASLKIVPIAAHALSEPPIAFELVRAMDRAAP